MAKPCLIDDTVCVQLCREIVVSVLVRECLPKGCLSDRSSFEGPPEGLSATPSGGAVRPPPGGLSQEQMRVYILVVGRL